MAFSLTSPVTGGAQTGLTSPTYTLAVDGAPSNAKAWAVTALGGTQTGVDTHSMSRPFTIGIYRPLVFKVLGKPNPTTGVIANIPVNIFKKVTTKGVTPQSGQPSRNARVVTTYEIPAGADVADAPNIRAMLSLDVGSSNQQSAGLGDTLISGLLT